MKISSNSQSHTLRFWEKQFKQIKPIKINNRRYYDQKNIDILIKIQYLLKNQGMTISGVKKILNSKNLVIDDDDKKNINTLNIKFRLIWLIKDTFSSLLLICWLATIQHR